MYGTVAKNAQPKQWQSCTGVFKSASGLNPPKRPVKYGTFLVWAKVEKTHNFSEQLAKQH
jgi:hypothetical protein